jgi:hypothetical protein
MSMMAEKKLGRVIIWCEAGCQGTPSEKIDSADGKWDDQFQYGLSRKKYLSPSDKDD